jgi:hypothetical protein
MCNWIQELSMMFNERIIPNFFIVGAPKCGTTSLSDYLKQHKNIFISNPKEPHYFAFDFDQYRTVKSFDQYRSLFEQCTQEHLRVGEASVLYLFSKAAIQNIYQFNDQAKIIVMIRNPIELVYSLHSQLLYSFHETEKNFPTAWKLQAERRKGKHIPKTCRLPELLQYQEIALIGKQVEDLLNYFPMDQIKFILFEEFKKNTADLYTQVLSFLNVPDDHRIDFPIVNQNKSHRSYLLARVLQKRNNQPALWLKRLDRRVSKIPGGNKLKLQQKILNLNLNTKKRAPIHPDLRKELVEVFRTDVLKLSKIIGRDLSHWIDS